MRKTAFITGITGQDGSYLAGLLPANEYVKSRWRRRQSDQLDDHVLTADETRSIRGFLDAILGRAGLDWHDHFEFDPRLLQI